MTIKIKTKYDTSKINDDWRPSCPFCHAPWTDDMIRVEDIWSSSGCDTCGWGSNTTYTVQIHCGSCKKLIYSKEGKKH